MKCIIQRLNIFYTIICHARLFLSDENECIINANICGNGTCTNVKGSFECTCNVGYSPGPFQICEDINECKEMGIGSQCAFRCHNVPGSFRCICPYGYSLAPDGRHCKGERSKAKKKKKVKSFVRKIYTIKRHLFKG